MEIGITALTKNADFMAAAKIQVAVADPGFQGAVRGAVSQPVFDIPADSSAPIFVDW